MIDGDALRTHPVAYSLTAEVHIGGGLEQDDLSVLDTTCGYVSVALGGEAGAETSGEGIGDTEADVVTCRLVLTTDIAEADDEVLHICM